VENASPPRQRNLFGIKDVFTTVNLLGGAVAICLCIEGSPKAAGVAVMLGYLADILDGWVARKLGTQNKFGGEYDTIADHLAHCIAPGAIVYTVYRDLPMGLGYWPQHALAGFLGCSIMVAASVRHARNIVRPIEWRGAWAGLPRSILGFVPIALVNAQLLPYLPLGYWLAVIVIPFCCIATLTYWPYTNHKLPRAQHGYVKVAIGLTFGTTFGSLAVAPGYFFDILCFWMTGYAVGAWVALTKEERKEFRAVVDAALARGEV
jgi:phosphatidylserine synthase